MKIFFICKKKCFFYNLRESSEDGYITESWLPGELLLYSERKLDGGTIISKVTILQTNIELPHIFLI